MKHLLSFCHKNASKGQQNPGQVATNKERKWSFSLPVVRLPWRLSEEKTWGGLVSALTWREVEKKKSNIKFSLKQKSALTWKPVCGSGGCLWNIQRGNTLQDARVLAHSGGFSPFFYSLRFSFPPQQALRGVTLILQDSVVQPDWKCLPFNPGTSGLWSGGADVDGNERGRLLPDLRRPAGSSTLGVHRFNSFSNEGGVLRKVDISPAWDSKAPGGVGVVSNPCHPAGVSQSTNSNHDCVMSSQVPKSKKWPR